MNDQPELIIVLAGGANEKGEIHDFVKKRLDEAIIFHQKYNIPILAAGGGTYHKQPITTSQGHVLHESTLCAQYLIDGGVKPTNILKEWSSYDTIGNVYFSLIYHVKILNIQRLLIITSDFHMPRSKILFQWIFNLDKKNYYQFYFHSSNNGVMNDLTLKCRQDREKSSLINVKENLVTNIDTMEQFHHWFFHEHRAYSAIANNCHINNGESLNADILKSY